MSQKLTVIVRHVVQLGSIRVWDFVAILQLRPVLMLRMSMILRIVCDVGKIFVENSATFRRGRDSEFRNRRNAMIAFRFVHRF